MKLRTAPALAVLAILATAGQASGYCRATTCDPATGSCTEDAAGCLRDGLPIFWRSSCITVSVQRDGAPNAGIDFDMARNSVARALAAWTSVDCPAGGNPSIQAKVNGPVDCKESEYNSDKRNANVVMFRDEVWPYSRESQDVLGYTRVRFDPDTGELYDVDIELNAVKEPLSTGRKPTDSEVDLDSLVAHEIGHLLGLNHSRDVAATMVSGYENGSIELRTPASDDIKGICAIYPPGRSTATDSCEPRHGFSELCGAQQPDDVPLVPVDGETGDPPAESGGCSVAWPTPSLDSGATLLVALFASVPWLRRRRHARPRKS